MFKKVITTALVMSFSITAFAADKECDGIKKLKCSTKPILVGSVGVAGGAVAVVNGKKLVDASKEGPKVKSKAVGTTAADAKAVITTVTNSEDVITITYDKTVEGKTTRLAKSFSGAEKDKAVSFIDELEKSGAKLKVVARTTSAAEHAKLIRKLKLRTGAGVAIVGFAAGIAYLDFDKDKAEAKAIQAKPAIEMTEHEKAKTAKTKAKSVVDLLQERPEKLDSQIRAAGGIQ